MAFVAGILTAEPGSAAAELTWETKAVERVVPRDEFPLDVKYRFVNSTAQVVFINAVSSSCHCTAATVQKKRYDPGEAGEIEVRYTLGEKLGTETRAIEVTTSLEPEKPTVLQLRVTAFDLLAVSPAVLQWERNAPPGEKTALIFLDHKRQLPPPTLGAHGSEVIARLLAGHDAHEYLLQIKPASTAAPLWSRLQVRLSTAAGDERTADVYVQVR
ncbi:MAG: hypothetical protein JWQ83_1341 [Lacunisphaera sp.]|nr:hypothetical protein [Lacunisphaera sp.]